MRPLVLLLPLLLLPACSEDATPTDTDTDVAVETATAKSGTFPVKRTYPAVASAAWEVEVYGRVEGWLEDRNFQQGHKVEQNDLLFTLQKDEFIADVNAARAALAEARAQAEYARITVGRNRPLVATGAISAEEFDQYVANLEVAVAEVSSAEAQLELADLNLEYTDIYAPISGRVGKSSVDPGTLVIPGTDNALLCTIIMTDPMRVNFAPSADEYPEYLARWKGGQPLHALVTNSKLKDWSRNGTISFVDNTADPTTSLISMWTDIPNDPEYLVPGQYCQVTVTIDHIENAVTIPSSALIQVGDGTYVWKVAEDKTVTETKVEVSMQQNSTAVISSGLKSGDEVVTEGIERIRFNGTKISKAPPPSPPGTPPPALDGSSGSDSSSSSSSTSTSSTSDDSSTKSDDASSGSSDGSSSGKTD